MTRTKFFINLFISLGFLLILPGFDLNAQKKEKKEKKEKKYTFNGYLKDLQSFYMFDGFEDLTGENRIHNRFNFKWFPNKNFTVGMGLRNQIIFGEFPKYMNDTFEAFSEIIEANPDLNIPLSYGELLEPNENLLPLAYTIYDGRSLLINTHLDRFWVDWYKGNWQVRIGRQRVNWGKNWVWNPNDLFNAYSFLDFDYEERPGSDAIRVNYFMKKNREIEVVFNPNKNFKEESIYGIKYAFNKWNYDFQLIASSFKTDIALGAGWAGNIKNAGFKGEMTYFVPTDSLSQEGLVAAIGIDYSFDMGLLVQTEILYNQFGSADQQNVLTDAFSGSSLGPKNLWSDRWAFILSLNYSVSPLINASLSSIINPESGAYFILPGVTFSLNENLDFYILAQITEKQILPAPLNKDFYGLLNTRLKWSF